MSSNLDPSKWKEKYVRGARAAASDWFNNFLATSGIAAAAASDTAQKRYERKMSDPTVLKKRQKRLAELTDEDFKAPVRAAGSTIYSTAVESKADKAAKRVEPFLKAIAEVLPTLPEKTDDPEANVDRRVKPIVRKLYELARK